ncbi:MAG: hypothetical protein KKA42_03745, partial [candidate division Zixibacteria bacterium]|nr:hypothetical protein [candidate division Zixibacteria bacterium]
MSASKKTEHVDCLGLGIMPLDLLFEVDRYPEAGSKIDGCGMTVQGGGPVPNVLVGLSRMGHSGTLITAVADDLTGHTGIAEMEVEGVDMRYVVRRKGTSDTAVGLIERGTGQRTMVLNRIIHVRPRDVNTAEYPVPRIVHLDGRDLEACMKLARWAHRQGAQICFDIGSVRNDISPILPLVDHLVVADVFAFSFTGCRNARRAVEKLRESCPGTVVATEGLKGATGCENNVWVTQRAFKVKSVDG